MMEYSSTCAFKMPYEQRAAIVSAASYENMEREIIHVSGAESGIQAYRVYYDTPPSETRLLTESIPVTPEHKIADDINDERLELLAEKYVDGHWSPEKEARLKINHKKVEQLYPSVTPEQFEEIERIRRNLKERDDTIDRMLDDLGIR